jgi:hypothetical protein
VPNGIAVSSPGPAPAGQNVTYTATITPGPGSTSAPTGSVAFYDGTTLLGTAGLNANSATFTTTSPPAIGDHAISADYSGDTDYEPSDSPTFQQVTQDPTSTTVASSQSPSPQGQSVTYTATISPSAGGVSTPTGTVTFYDGTTRIGTAGVASGDATLTTSPGVGEHAISADYGGDANYEPSDSPAFQQSVQATPAPAPTPVASGGVEAAHASATAPPPPPPIFSQTANVAPVSGTVLVELPGTDVFVDVTTLRRIPIGAILDARRGTVAVTTAANSTSTASQTADFSEGEFEIRQPANQYIVPVGTIASVTAAKLGPYTDIALYGGDFAVCNKHTGRDARTATASSKTVLRKLLASGHGLFRTVGTDASAAVRGTTWLTEDLCGGTLIEVPHGIVQVDDFIHHREVLVKTGHSYLA